MYIVLVTSGTKNKVEKAFIRVFDDSFKMNYCINANKWFDLGGSWSNAKEIAAEQDIFPFIVVPEWFKER